MEPASTRTRLKELRVTRSLDPLWWVLSILLGIACLKGPVSIGIVESQGLRSITIGSVFLCSVFLGFANPRNSWRWGVAMVVAMPVMEVLKIPEATALIRIPISYWIDMLKLQAPAYALYGAVSIFGSGLGSYMSK